MATATPTQTLPLVALLSRLEATYLAEFDRRLASSQLSSLSLAHSRNVLRHLADGPLRASALVERSGVTKQAISQQLGHLEREGYVRSEPDPADQRARLLLLTPKGECAQALVRQVFLEIEADWERQLGDGELGAAREILTQLLERTASCDAPLEPDC